MYTCKYNKVYNHELSNRGGTSDYICIYSADGLKELILGKEVSVIPMGIDKYDRELACLLIQTTLGQIDVAECMINRGAAFDWGGKYYKAQEYAQEYNLGVWSDTKFQERPWFYRKRTQ